MAHRLLLVGTREKLSGFPRTACQPLSLHSSGSTSMPLWNFLLPRDWKSLYVADSPIIVPESVIDAEIWNSYLTNVKKLEPLLFF